MFKRLSTMAVLMGLLFCGTASAAEITIKAAHNTGAGCEQSVPFAVFKDYVEKASNGRIEVVIYENSSMGGCLETLEKAQMNIIQLAFGSSSNLSSVVPELEVLELPYLCEKPEENMKLFYNKDGKLDGPVYQRLEDEFEKLGVKIVLISPYSPRALGMNSKCQTMKDIKGKKLRSTASRIERDVISAMGASPATISFAECYTALQLKTIDGIGLNYSTILISKFYENLKSLIFVPYNGFFMIASMNKAFYEGLPDWAKPIVDAGLDKALQEANKQWVTIMNDSVATMEKEGILCHTPTADEMKEWRAAAQPVYDEYSAIVDQDFLKLVKERLGK